MRVLMLGWEFPPFISGGLGTACFGLTKALHRCGHAVSFVLPKAVERSFTSHVELLSPEMPEAHAAGIDLPPSLRDRFQAIIRVRDAREESNPIAARSAGLTLELATTPRDRYLAIPSEIAHAAPYTHAMDPELAALQTYAGGVRIITLAQIEAFRRAGLPVEGRFEIVTDDEMELIRTVLDAHIARPGAQPSNDLRADYAGDVVEQTRAYARLALSLARGRKFDVIHAHDWMTYPAGVALAQLTGKPLVAHIHSTEFDRSGDHVNQPIYDIERRGMHAAVRVIAVSMLTKGICVQKYGVPAERIEVVYNGVDFSPTTGERSVGIKPKEKIVLFLGRITMQKGPEYFVRAAKRVLEVMEDVKFVVAGNGDMARRMIELAAEMGIGHKVLFTGFLRGKDVQRVFAMADCYVMPSVSEPFGIAPLEAISHDTPTIISKQSGVSEVLRHVLKVDFWDTDEMANKIVAVLRHPVLSQTLREHGSMEVRSLTWDGAAERCAEIYRKSIDIVSTPIALPVG
ncbi:MAG: glycosyltransferase [Phycisphaerales bacterium]